MPMHLKVDKMFSNSVSLLLMLSAFHCMTMSGFEWFPWPVTLLFRPLGPQDNLEGPPVTEVGLF